MATKSIKQAAEAQLRLLGILSPGDNVYTLTVSARSGMTRWVRLFIVRDGQLIEITHQTGLALEMSQSDKGLRVGGCGFNAGHHVVYGLGYALWPNGTPEPHSNRNGRPDHSGGYALKQQEL